MNLNETNLTISNHNYSLIFPIGAIVAGCEIVSAPEVFKKGKTTITQIAVKHSCGHTFKAKCADLAKGKVRCPECEEAEAYAAPLRKLIGQVIGKYVITGLIERTPRNYRLKLRCTKCGLEGERSAQSIIGILPGTTKARRFDPSHCPRCELIDAGLLQLPGQKPVTPKVETLDELLSEISGDNSTSYESMLEA